MIGGVVATTLVTAILLAALGQNPLGALVLGPLLGLTAQAGDLAESMLKRAAGAEGLGRAHPRARRDARPDRLVPVRRARGRAVCPRPRRLSRRPLGVALLGSTGSIGTQTVDVLEAHADRFRVVALATGRNAAELEAQAARLRPAAVALADDGAALDLPAGTTPGPRRTTRSWSSRPATTSTS